FFIALEVPDASTRPFAIASASRTEKSLSTVTILPLNRTISADCAQAVLTKQARARASTTPPYFGEPNRNAPGVACETDMGPPAQPLAGCLWFLCGSICATGPRRDQIALGVIPRTTKSRSGCRRDPGNRLTRACRGRPVFW